MIALYILAWLLAGVVPAYIAYKVGGDYYAPTRAHLVGIAMLGPVVPVVIVLDWMVTSGFWSKGAWK